MPFECFHASVVSDAKLAEARIHNAFGNTRVNKNREFFEIEPERIREILLLIQLEDVTPNRVVYETIDDKTALENFERRRDKFSFAMVDIPVGAQLTFLKDASITATVLDNNLIKFQGKDYSLSASALKILNTLGYSWTRAHGPAYWCYEGETLNERRKRLESE